RESRPIVDRSGRVIALLGGSPRDPAWDDVEKEAQEAIVHAEAKIKFTAKQKTHRRGPSPAVTKGLSHGGGQTEPGLLSNTAKTNAALTELFATKAIRRFVGFANRLLELWAPGIFQDLGDQLRNFCKHNAHLSIPLNFSLGTSVFAAATVNFGPAAVSFPHLDFNNLAWAWCAITAFGNFNPDRGGHLILWDLGLIIRFPPGSTILIPSALLWHSNVKIQAGETRQSFTQYSAGGLFRWEANGFMTDDDFEAIATPEQKKDRAYAAKTRWTDAMAKYSHISDFFT
ncbi:hypothetical protein GGX14DRAFT_375892, partial [Mycena pura]